MKSRVAANGWKDLNDENSSINMMGVQCEAKEEKTAGMTRNASTTLCLFGSVVVGLGRGGYGDLLYKDVMKVGGETASNAQESRQALSWRPVSRFDELDRQPRCCHQ